MSGKNWTAGPWSVKLETGKIHATLFDSLGKMLAIFKKSPSEHDLALIAAAPDLYEALENLLGVVYGVGGTKPNAQQLAKKALAKARGEK